MGIFHPQKSIRTEIEKSSTYNCLIRLLFYSSLDIFILVHKFAHTSDISSRARAYKALLGPAVYLIP